MDHAYFKDRLSALFDNELPPQEKQVVEEHVRDCAECQAELARLKQLDEAVTRHSQLADTDYWEKSAQKIEQRLGFELQTVVTPIGRKWYEKGTAWKMVAAAASIAALAYIGINSDKILKREDLTPKPTIQSPSVTPTEQVPEVTVDTMAKVKEQPEVSTLQKIEVPKPAYSIPPKPLKSNKAAAPAVAKTPPLQPEEKDIKPAESIITRDSLFMGHMPDITRQEIKSRAGRSAPAPGSLSEQTAKSAPVPIADSASAGIRDQVREDALAYTDSVAADTMLTFWRKKRDALQTVQKTIPDMFGMLEKRAAAPTSLKSTEKKADTTEPKLTQQETEKQLLEAWYNIAKLTSDKTEREKAVAFIRKVADDRRSPNRSFAVRYMQELGER